MWYPDKCSCKIWKRFKEYFKSVDKHAINWWEDRQMDRGTDGQHHFYTYYFMLGSELIKLEQLECLRSDDTPAASWLPILLDPKSKEDKVKVTNLKNLPKFQIFEFWNKHYTHVLCNVCLKIQIFYWDLLKLLDKMCKYEMDPTSIVEDAERTRFCPQTDRRTRWNQYTPLSTSLNREV